MNRRVEIDLSVRLRSPFLMQGLAAGRLGLDATALRDEEGRPLVPADQVKGLLRAACFTLSQATNGRLVDQDAIDALFGAESPKRGTTGSGEQDAPNRGALIVGDLAGPAKLGASTATRVHIDPATGAARTGHLQIVELAAPLGTEVTFTPSAETFTMVEFDYKTLEHRLRELAARHLRHLEVGDDDVEGAVPGQ